MVAWKTNGGRRDGHPIMLPAVALPRWMTFAEHRLPVPGGELRVLQPSEAAELPDDGPVEWAPLVPYWSVLWRSGVALGRSLAAERRPLDGLRVVELGCGLGVPSLVAARAGAGVLATDGEEEALEMVERNARENGLSVETARIDWDAADPLLARAPFDLVLAADVLYERAAVAKLLALLPRLGDEVLLADPGRQPTDEFLQRAAEDWSIETMTRDEVRIYRLVSSRQAPAAR
jgi:predicted nicotinamide N-methyase